MRFSFVTRDYCAIQWGKIIEKPSSWASYKLVSLGCRVVPDPSKVIIYISHAVRYPYDIAQCVFLVYFDPTMYFLRQTHCKPKPCKFILPGKNLFSLQGTPVLIAGSFFYYRDFPVNPCTSLLRIAVHLWFSHFYLINFSDSAHKK